MRNVPGASHAQPATLLLRAAEAAKCAPCGCARSAVAAIEAASDVSPDVAVAAARLGAALVEQRYDCLGCSECWPAEALRVLEDEGVGAAALVCPTGPVASRAGWPPMPGAYTVVRWSAPVAVCTLGDADLAEAVVSEAGADIAIVGTMTTENLGIERLITNTIANPNLRFVVVAGRETRRAVGHLPGASLLALAAHGIDANGRIVGAPGRRAVLANIVSDAVDAFRTVVEVVDLIGERDPRTIVAAARACGLRNPGPAGGFGAVDTVVPTIGTVPARMTTDPAGYFVVFADRARQLLSLEHYTNDGVLDAILEGPTPAHCYTAAIERRLLTRLDHAAYLGRELARAELELELDTAGPYVQDAAPEAPKDATMCGPACEEAGCPSAGRL